MRTSRPSTVLRTSLASTTFVLFIGALGSGMGSGCSSSETSASGDESYFLPNADLTNSAQFFDLPYPSDARLTAKGTPDLRGYPIPEIAANLVKPLRDIASERRGFPMTPIAYFRFHAELATHAPTDTVAAAFASPVFLVDLEGAKKGELVPTVLATPPSDSYAPDFLLAAAPKPGFVLRPAHKYAFVVTSALKTKAGASVKAPASLLAVLKAQDASHKALVDMYMPLTQVLGEKGVTLDQVAAATVFTTGDVVKDTFDLSEKTKAAYKVEITGLKVEPKDGANHPGYCELLGSVTFPQFQKGTPPFDTEGLFELDENGVPKKQRDETSPVTVSIPKGKMPKSGFPLTIYFHGSGGQGAELVDASRSTVKGEDGPPGEGPAAILAPLGIAGIASSLPFSTDRFPNAAEQEYLNFDNLSAFRDTFRQGILEQRMFLEAIRTLKIDPATYASCTGIDLDGQASAFFDESKLIAMGQSMGGAYTNYLSGLEPRVKIAVPTGAGGYWSYFVLETKLVPGVKKAVGGLLGTAEELTFLHPAMNIVQTGWEPIDPLVYTPRLAVRPLPGHPIRPIYEPAGKDDRYFPTPIYDAMATAYGNHEAGDSVWPTMQTSLTLAGRGGILPYPVTQNGRSDSGENFTGVVVQYNGDGIGDPHAIYRQLDQVKYQYGCFLTSFLSTGVAKVPAPAALGTPCP